MRACGFFLRQSLLTDLQTAVEAKSVLAAAPLQQRQKFLLALRAEIVRNQNSILHANRLDSNSVSVQPSRTTEEATGAKDKEEQDEGRHVVHRVSSPRPLLSEHYTSSRRIPLRVDKLISEMDYLLTCKDPIEPDLWKQRIEDPKSFAIDKTVTSDPQIYVSEVTVPLGFVGVLSRYRPRMMLEAVGMGILAGNVVLVDGGVSVRHTNYAFMSCIQKALAVAELPPSAVVHVDSNDIDQRKTVEWLQVKSRVDVAIVCGPPRLYEFALQRSSIPLVRATSQSTSLYIDRTASFETALEVIVNSKFQRLGAANALTLVLLHKDFPRYVELLKELSEAGAILLGDRQSMERGGDWVRELASDEEIRGIAHSFRDMSQTLCIQTMDSLEQVLLFLDLFGSKQSDGIVTNDEVAMREYCSRVDSAVVLVNASTRLSSGKLLGLGPDMAIATSKVNHRGPLTLSTWTTRKFVVRSKSPNGALRR